MMPELKPEAISLLERVKSFVSEEVLPKEHLFHEQIKVGSERWNPVSYTHLTLPTSDLV